MGEADKSQNRTRKKKDKSSGQEKRKANDERESPELAGRFLRMRFESRRRKLRCQRRMMSRWMRTLNVRIRRGRRSGGDSVLISLSWSRTIGVQESWIIWSWRRTRDWWRLRSRTCYSSRRWTSNWNPIQWRRSRSAFFVWSAQSFPISSITWRTLSSESSTSSW